MSETGRNLLKITKLDLSGQKLEEIPEYVYQCRNLRKLILHENNIGKIPSKIKALKRLRLLDLSNNKLSVINYQLIKLPNLRILNLSYNSILSIPREIIASKIEQLILIGNELKKVRLNDWENLKRLNVSNNDIKTIELYGDLSNLEYLWFGNNPLQTIVIPQASLPKVKGIYTYTHPQKLKEVNIRYQQLLSKRENVAYIFWNQIYSSQNKIKNMTATECKKQSQQLLADYLEKLHKAPNDQETITAYHDWYNNACVMFVNKFGNNDPDVVKFRNVNNKGNGYTLQDNYYDISSSYAILLSRMENNEMESNKKMENQKHLKVFISHSSKDKYFVEALVRLLEFIGLDDSILFCSSVQGYGIGFNNDIYDTLQEQFKNYNLYVIFIHSKNFYSSNASLNEMGAAWVMKTDFCSFLTKDFDFKDMDGAIKPNDKISIKVDNDDAKSLLNDFKEHICQIFNLPSKNGNIWEKRRDEFLKTVLNP